LRQDNGDAGYFVLKASQNYGLTFYLRYVSIKGYREPIFSIQKEKSLNENNKENRPKPWNIIDAFGKHDKLRFSQGISEDVPE
jgi:hypothetical protein